MNMKFLLSAPRFEKEKYTCILAVHIIAVRYTDLKNFV